MTHLITAYILNIVDYIFTAYWVHNFGIEIEANPIGRWMFEHNVAWVVKIVGVGLLLLVLYHALKVKPTWAWVSWVLLAVYGVLVLYHIFIALSIYIPTRR